MKLYVVFTEDVAKGKNVNDEEQGPQDRALRHTCGDWEWMGSE